MRIQVFPLLERLEHSTGQRQARQFSEALADQLCLCAVERVFRHRVCNFNHAVGIQLQNGIKGVVQQGGELRRPALLHFDGVHCQPCPAERIADALVRVVNKHRRNPMRRGIVAGVFAADDGFRAVLDGIPRHLRDHVRAARIIHPHIRVCQRTDALHVRIHMPEADEGDFRMFMRYQIARLFDKARHFLPGKGDLRHRVLHMLFEQLRLIAARNDNARAALHGFGYILHHLPRRGLDDLGVELRRLHNADGCVIHRRVRRDNQQLQHGVFSP